jgi:hypothetical protein
MPEWYVYKFQQHPTVRGIEEKKEQVQHDLNFTKEQLEEAIKLYEGGMSLFEVGLKFKEQGNFIRRRLKAAGVQLRVRVPIPPTEEQIDKMVELYQGGLSSTRVGKKIGFSETLVLQKLVERQVDIRHKGFKPNGERQHTSTYVEDVGKLCDCGRALHHSGRHRNMPRATREIREAAINIQTMPGAYRAVEDAIRNTHLNGGEPADVPATLDDVEDVLMTNEVAKSYEVVLNDLRSEREDAKQQLDDLDRLIEMLSRHEPVPDEGFKQ